MTLPVETLKTVPRGKAVWNVNGGFVSVLLTHLLLYSALQKYILISCANSNLHCVQRVEFVRKHHVSSTISSPPKSFKYLREIPTESRAAGALNTSYAIFDKQLAVSRK